MLFCNHILCHFYCIAVLFLYREMWKEVTSPATSYVQNAGNIECSKSFNKFGLSRARMTNSKQWSCSGWTVLHFWINAQPFFYCFWCVFEDSIYCSPPVRIYHTIRQYVVCLGLTCSLVSASPSRSHFGFAAIHSLFMTLQLLHVCWSPSTWSHQYSQSLQNAHFIFSLWQLITECVVSSQ